MRALLCSLIKIVNELVFFLIFFMAASIMTISMFRVVDYILNGDYSQALISFGVFIFSGIAAKVAYD